MCDNKTNVENEDQNFEIIVTYFSDIENSDIASQAFTFFLGGFDTMATIFSFMSIALALHPEIQTKVRDEVKTMMEKNRGKMTYDSVKELKYLDMVISGK